jgi:hypothetical protein
MLANLRALFGVVVDIVFLRRGPENMPASNSLLGIVVVVYVALYALAYQAFILPQLPNPPRAWALQIVCASLLELLWFRVGFQLAGKAERFTQTATAIFATSLLFIPSLAVIGSLMPYMEAGMKEGSTVQPPALASFLSAFIMIWMIVILVRIVRSAFEWNWPRSIFFVIGANLVPIIILSLVFGESQKPV